jgi:hypothetical protein
MKKVPTKSNKYALNINMSNFLNNLMLIYPRENDVQI